MPITHYRVNELYRCKAEIYALEALGKSQTEAAKLLSVARNTYRKFLKSQEYTEFKISIGGNQALSTILGNGRNYH